MLEAYRVEDGYPVLHGNTLENREHRESDVIKGGEPVVGSGPLLQAYWGIGITHIRPPGSIWRITDKTWTLF